MWEVARAVRSTRAAEPDAGPEAVVELVSETSGIPVRWVRAALDYWASYPEEIDGWIARADSEAAEAEARWHREQALLGQ